MGSSWVLLCAIALRLVLRGAALEDQPYVIPRQLEQQPFQDQRPVGQRPITFFPKKALQRPSIPSFEPKRRGIFSSETVIPRQIWDPPYRHRLQYLPDDKYERMTAAVNSAESWFGICIRLNQMLQNDTVLCCATQAVKRQIQTKVFDVDSPNPSYKPTQKRPVFSNLRLKAKFNFDPSTCPRKNNKTSFTSQKIDMNFPLGQPTADNIESLCRTWRLRPLYSSKCFKRSGYEFAARQAKSINSLEKEFRQCCTTSDHKLNCASQKWREEVEKFCLVEKKHTSFECCSGIDPFVWSACFKSMSPDPHYNTSAHEAPSFGELCENTTSLLNRIPDESRLRTFLSECCTVPVPLKTISITKFSEMSQDTCLIGEPPSPDVKLCCRLMHEIAEETNVRQKRKICPIPSKPPMSLAFV